MKKMVILILVGFCIVSSDSLRWNCLCRRRFHHQSCQGFGELIGLVYRLVCLAVAETKAKTVFHNQSMEQGFYLDRICKLSKTDSEPIWKKVCTDMETLCSEMGLNLSKRWWSASFFSRLLRSECDNETIGRVAQQILNTVRNNPLVVQDLGWVYEDLLSHRSQITNGVFTISKSKMSQQTNRSPLYSPRYCSFGSQRPWNGCWKILRPGCPPNSESGSDCLRSQLR